VLGSAGLETRRKRCGCPSTTESSKSSGRVSSRQTRKTARRGRESVTDIARRRWSVRAALAGELATARRPAAAGSVTGRAGAGRGGRTRAGRGEGSGVGRGGGGKAGGGAPGSAALAAWGRPAARRPAATPRRGARAPQRAARRHGPGAAPPRAASR
jgi:hypothetical protein